MLHSIELIVLEFASSGNYVLARVSKRYKNSETIAELVSESHNTGSTSLKWITPITKWGAMFRISIESSSEGVGYTSNLKVI